MSAAADFVIKAGKRLAGEELLGELDEKIERTEEAIAGLKEDLGPLLSALQECQRVLGELQRMQRSVARLYGGIM